jgi:DNA helicase-2/ATP-dependent DNA helicase PcrA
MEKRFKQLCENTVGVTFGTFHSVFFMILRYAYNYSGKDILTDGEGYAFVRGCIDKYGLQYDSQDDFAKNLLGEIGRVKSEMTDLKTYVSDSVDSGDFKLIYEDYEKFLRDNNKIDFDDMLVFTYELFRERADILKNWQNRYKYILIDEFQDINRIQYEIVKMLAGESRNVFAVGDDDQSIYGFRGAVPEIMQRFPKDYPGTEISYLSVNYRCSHDIVECSKRLISCNKNRYEKNLKSAFDAGKSDRVHVVKAKTTRDECDKVVEKIRELNGKNISFSQMAVIFRTNTEPRALSARLMEEGIPFVMRDNIPNIFNHFLARLIFDYISIVNGCRDRAVFLRVINKPSRYVSRDAFENPQVNFESLREYYKNNYRMVNNINVFANDIEKMGKMKPYAAVNYLRKAVGIDAYVKEYAENRGVSQEDYVEILDDVQESARNFESYDKWFDYIEEYGKELKERNAKRRQPQDGVTLSSMHGAKGLEYSYVFVMNAVEGVIPHKKSIDSDSVEEERRLFYVAITRAKYGLYVYVPEKMYGKEKRMSRFLDEILVDRELLKVGNKIRHRKIGDGVITYVDGERIDIRFEKSGITKSFNLAYTLEKELIENR